MERATDNLVFFVNGEKIEIQNPDPCTTLLQYLRRNLYLTGAKEACGQGGCGACTVMLSSYKAASKKIVHLSANACLVPLCYLHGMAVTTVEGVGSLRNGLHPVQESLVKSHGIQCGFCSPGMVMSMYTLLKNNPNPTDDQLERGLEGNLCRCTGYRPIVEAFKDARKNCPCGLGLCQGGNENQTVTDDFQSQKLTNVKKRNTQDVIFPPELQLKDSNYKSSVKFGGQGGQWYRPSSLSELLDLKSAFPDALLVMGCNSVGYLMRKNKDVKNVICGTHVEELLKFEVLDKGVNIGAGVTLSQMESYLEQTSQDIGAPKNRTLVAILESIRWIAADQIRNTSTLGGYVMTKAPNLELQPLLMSISATLNFSSKDNGSKVCVMDSKFIQDGILTTSDVLVSITVPFAEEGEFVAGYKQSHRKGFDFGTVISSMFIKFQPESSIIQNARFSFCGFGPRPKMAPETAKRIANMEWSEQLLSDVTTNLIEDLTCDSFDDITFRLTMACSHFYRFYQQVNNKLNVGCGDGSGLQPLTFPPSTGLQLYDIPDAEGKGVIWKPVPNVAGESLATGTAMFIDDLPSYRNELFAAVVTSKRAHARILSVDPAKALAVAGVVRYIDHKDVLQQNQCGADVQDCFLFAEDKVSYHGQVIGAILAEDRETASHAAGLVEIKYDDLDAVYTIQEAIDRDSLYDWKFEVNKGDVDKTFKEAEFCLEGVSETGAQEHMYLEPQTTLVIPKKDQNELEVLSSTQDLSGVQGMISTWIGLPRNRVLTKVKRVGGGFGGKQSDSVAIAGIAAVGAWATDRPVRCTYDRATDVRVTGKRHPFKIFYKVCFNKEGKILAMDNKYYLNAGYSSQTSFWVLRVAMIVSLNGYNIPHVREVGRVCRTNIPSNTAFRGFGGPQACVAMEDIIQNVAHRLQMSPEQVRERNLIRVGDTTPFHMTLRDDNLHRCWEECVKLSSYDQRVSEIQEFNKSSRWKKRGMAMTPVMFPVGHPLQSSNQSASLVMIYLDGSVLLAHGGIEMGQGLNTKAVQVAATELGVPVERVIIHETSTGTIPNQIVSGGSFTSEMVCGGVADACRKLRRSLEPYIAAKPNGTWEDWVNDAFADRVNLSVTGLYKTNKKNYYVDTNEGEHCQYFTFGVGYSEVELDCLTGEHKINRTDIVMDIGKSINPAVNISQIEGGFVQGYGMMTSEKLFLTNNGQMITSGPLNYKIPGIRNIPREFRVQLLKDSEGDRDVYSAKGLGEPPLFLATSVHQALKYAVLEARKEAGVTDNFHLQCPATVEVLRMACQDDFTKKCHNADIPVCKNPRIAL